MSSQFFKMTGNRGMILVVLAVVMPFIVMLPPAFHLYVYIPWFGGVKNVVDTFFLALLGGVLGSLLASIYATLARSPSILVKRLCVSSVAIAIVAYIIFFSLAALRQWVPIEFRSNAALGSIAVLLYIAIFLNIYVTSTELGKRYLLQGHQTSRNDTVHAWAAFLFSVDSLLLVGWLTLGVYSTLRM